MPFLIVIGAAYAAYAKHKKKQNLLESALVLIDPAINIKGKTCIELNTFERELSVLELPIATISFFNGNIRTVEHSLRIRCEEILKINPWLSGWLLPIPELKIVYDKTGQDHAPGHFVSYQEGEIPLKYDTPYSMYTEILRDALVPSNLDLVGQNLPLWKVALIPDVVEPYTKFALVVSMSHAVGDVHTYYKLYNMLSQNTPIVALNPIRDTNYKNAVIKNLGSTEALYFNKILEDEGFEAKTSEQVVEELDSVVNDSKHGTSSSSRIGVNDNKKEEDHNMHVVSNRRSSSQALLMSFKELEELDLESETVLKMFYINENWVMRQRGGGSRRGSIFEGDDDDIISNTTTTANNNTTDVAVPNNTANSIISSWFFNINNAHIGMMMVSLRHRLHGCNISDTSAGNYVHALICGTDDFNTPTSVQSTLQNLKSSNPNLLSFDPLKSSSICTNWANFFQSEIILGPDCNQIVHLPMYSTDVLHLLPSKISAINIFTARCANNNGVERRAGAFVICQENVWKKIQQSGIVDEMIADEM